MHRRCAWAIFRHHRIAERRVALQRRCGGPEPQSVLLTAARLVDLFGRFHAEFDGSGQGLLLRIVAARYISVRDGALPPPSFV